MQGRLALLTGTSVALAVLFAGTTSFFITRWSLLDQLDHELLASARAAATIIATNPRNDLEDLAGPAITDQWLAVVSAAGETVSVPNGARLFTGPQEIAVARLQTGSSARSIDVIQADGASIEYRVVSVPMTLLDNNDKPTRHAVMLGRPLTALNSTLKSLWVVIVFAGLVGVLVTTLAALWVAQAALAPVRRLSMAVRSVTQTDQLNPIRIYGRDDLGELTKSFNSMLKSLQSSREQQRQFIADAGHELRTPLTSMRTNIELLVADDKAGMLPEGARSEILDDVSAQLGEFSALVGDLVALTRDDHLQRKLEPLDLSEVVESALSRARRRGPGITFDVELDHTQCLGDAQNLERAITNLLDNAVKFSPPEGTVTVTLNSGVITIVDEGPGIAEDDLEHIFDRFYRSDRARNTPGTGLGLSIVAHTAEAHGGTVRAGNQPGSGAKFTLRVPNLTPDAEPSP
ncbi:sensor histidine kinase [Tessaracoccus antarcticus]|uniref:histidine kinase n=1 Tax=Tessaracoccus antarcticus TaxID=2479848 RepID=A0A3M0GL81_9ACTN|nr:sensor histidine kinase [Tessaracoccus antarcticus]